MAYVADLEPEVREALVTALDTTAVFSGFPAEVLLRLAEAGKVATFAPGSVLYHQGEQLTFSYLVLRGRVSLQKRHSSFVDAIEVSGRTYAAMIPDRPLAHAPCPMTAVAAEETEVLVLADGPLLAARLAVPEQAEAAATLLFGQPVTLTTLRCAAQRVMEGLSPAAGTVP